MNDTTEQFSLLFQIIFLNSERFVTKQSFVRKIVDFVNKPLVFVNKSQRFMSKTQQDFVYKTLGFVKLWVLYYEIQGFVN